MNSVAFRFAHVALLVVGSLSMIATARAQQVSDMFDLSQIEGVQQVVERTWTSANGNPDIVHVPYLHFVSASLLLFNSEQDAETGFDSIKSYVQQNFLSDEEYQDLVAVTEYEGDVETPVAIATGDDAAEIGFNGSQQYVITLVPDQELEGDDVVGVIAAVQKSSYIVLTIDVFAPYESDILVQDVINLQIENTANLINGILNRPSGTEGINQTTTGYSGGVFDKFPSEEGDSPAFGGYVVEDDNLAYIDPEAIVDGVSPAEIPIEEGFSEDNVSWEEFAPTATVFAEQTIAAEEQEQANENATATVEAGWEQATATEEAAWAQATETAIAPTEFANQTATADAWATGTAEAYVQATESTNNVNATIESEQAVWIQTEAAVSTEYALEFSATMTAEAEIEDQMTATAEFGFAVATIDAEHTATAFAEAMNATDTPTPEQDEPASSEPGTGLLAYAAPAGGAFYPTKMVVQDVTTGTTRTIMEVADPYTIGKPVWAPWGSQLYFTVHGDGPDAGIWGYGYGTLWKIEGSERCMMPAFGDLPDMILMLCEESPNAWNVSIYNLTAGMMHDETYPLAIDVPYNQLDVQTLEYNSVTGHWLLAWDSEIGFNPCTSGTLCEGISYGVDEWDWNFANGLPVLFGEFATQFDHEGPWNVQYSVDQQAVLGLVCDISCTSNTPTLYNNADFEQVWVATPGTFYLEFDQHPNGTWWAFSVGGKILVGADPQSATEIGTGFTPAWQPVEAELE